MLTVRKPTGGLRAGAGSVSPEGGVGTPLQAPTGAAGAARAGSGSRAGQADSDLPTFPARKESRTPAGGQGPRLPVVLRSNQTFPEPKERTGSAGYSVASASQFSPSWAGSGPYGHDTKPLVSFPHPRSLHPPPLRCRDHPGPPKPLH